MIPSPGFIILFILNAVLACPNSLYGQEWNITDFGAVGDGITINTGQIQQAVDRCHEKGGTVIVPPGTFLTGTLFLKDDVSIRLMNRAVLKGSPQIKDYPAIMPEYRSYTDNYVKHCLIYAEKAKNIILSGEGTIDGNGNASDFRISQYIGRPFVIRFVQCSDIKIKGIRLVNSPMWMQHYLACENLLVDNITVYNHSNYNNDGLDIDGCKNVMVSNCLIDSDDDALVLKSTSPAPCENITINNCIFSSHCNSIKCGTESTGGFKNITISNCVVKQSEDEDPMNGIREGLSAIALEIVDGGIMDGVIISDIIADGVRTPLFIRLGNRARIYTENEEKPGVGVLKNIRINNLLAKDAGVISSSVTGIPEKLAENIHLSNITIISKGGGRSIDMEDIPENQDSYPDPDLFKSNLPSYGLYLRHVKNIRIDNVNLDVTGNDERPALVMDDVISGRFSNLNANGLSPDQQKIRQRNSKELIIENEGIDD